MKDDLRPIPEVTIRTEDSSYFRYTEGEEIKVTAYRRYTKVLQVNFDFQNKTARVICNHPSKEDIVNVEKLVREYLPEKLFLTELLWNAIRGNSGVSEVKWND